MKPSLSSSHNLVALVGRPNVGKSSLFNRIVKQRKSLVHDEPGVTRDRIFGRCKHAEHSFYVCDTGGFEPTSKDTIKMQLVEQAELAIEEAQLVLFVVDGREGLHPIDAELIKRLRKSQKEFFVCVNKCDLPKDDYLVEEFRKLGTQDLFSVSAEHRRGIDDLLDRVVEKLGNGPKIKAQPGEEESIRLSIMGRPNVGKSSILNRIIGSKRSIVDDRPGTTRDAVDVQIKYHGRTITLIDTAGIRRKSRMVDKLEKFSAFRSMVCLEESDVAVLVINAQDGVTEGDVRVAGYAFELRKPILIVVNKWDLIENKTSKSSKEFEEKLRIDLRYIPYAPILFMSALENLRVNKILPECLELYDQSSKRVTTGKVNNALKEILKKHTPPLLKNKSRRIKFYYATQVTVNPPRFVIFCSHPDDLHFSYKRFIENEFRELFGYKDIPIHLIFRERNRTSLDDLKNGNVKKKIDNRNEDDDIRSMTFSDDFEDRHVMDGEDIEFDDDDK